MEKGKIYIEHGGGVREELHGAFREIRGTLRRKKKNLSGKFYFVIDDGTGDQRVEVGRIIFEKNAVGDTMTVGCIGDKMVSFRPGIVQNEDELPAPSL